MMKMSISPFVFVLVGSLMGACADPATVSCPDDPQDCGCRGPCPEPGQYCVAGECVGGDTADKCGPAGLQCEAGYACSNGACVCDNVARPDDPRACGCPAVDCGDGRCVAGACLCDPEKHKLDQHACGCNPEPIDCDEMGPGNTCIQGVCTCDWTQHLNDSSNCRCLGACPDEKVCQSGRCTCPGNTIPCGDSCIPSGNSCCDDAAGASCAAGQVCEQAVTGWMCRPAASVACYDDSYFSSFCSPGEQCAGRDCAPASWTTCADGSHCAPGTTCDRTDQGYTCRPNELTPCYWDANLIGTCQPGQQCVALSSTRRICIDRDETYCDLPGGTPHTCAAGYSCLRDGCLAPGRMLCSSSPELSCPPSTTCARGADGYYCVDDAEIACDLPGGQFHTCARGWTCTRTSCLPPGWSLCSQYSERMCPPQDRCIWHEDGYYDCLHRDMQPCFNGHSAWNGLSCAVLECYLCNDGESRCGGC